MEPETYDQLLQAMMQQQAPQFDWNAYNQAQIRAQDAQRGMDRTRMQGNGLMGLVGSMLANRAADKRRPVLNEALLNATNQQSMLGQYESALDRHYDQQGDYLGRGLDFFKDKDEFTRDEAAKRKLSDYNRAADERMKIGAENRPTFDRGHKLNKEWMTNSKEFASVTDSFGRLVASAQDPSPAGDLALIFNYMKMLDPGSVVRESEFANAAATGSFGERMKAAVARIQSGERLSEEMRADFFNRGRTLYTQAADMHQRRFDEYSYYTQGQGFDPEKTLLKRQVLDVPEQMVAAQEGQRLSPEQAQQLPSGTKFIDVDGNERVRQ